jgi:hypothetical protein
MTENAAPGAHEPESKHGTPRRTPGRGGYRPIAVAEVISASTWAGVGVVAAIMVALAVLEYLSSAYASLAGYKLVAEAVALLLPLGVTAIIIPIANAFGPGVVRLEWRLIAFALLSIGLGAVVWAILTFGFDHGIDAYPSIAEVFTLSGYALFGSAFFLAIRSYRQLFSIRRALIVAVAAGAVALVLSYLFLVAPFLIASKEGLAVKTFNTLYVVLDVIVLLMPNVALGLLLSRLGKGRIAWPWWLVAAGAATLAVSDMVANAGWGRAPLVDLGYALAPMLIGIAALVARDAYSS